MNELEQFLSKCEATYTGSVSSVGEYLKGQTMAYEALPLLVKMLRAIIARADRDNLLYGGEVEEIAERILKEAQHE